MGHDCYKPALVNGDIDIGRERLGRRGDDDVPPAHIHDGRHQTDSAADLMAARIR